MDLRALLWAGYRTATGWGGDLLALLTGGYLTTPAGGAQALGEISQVVDVARMVGDGTLWAARYDAGGLSGAPLLVLNVTDERRIGLAGERGIHEATATAEEIAGPATSLGVLSLHPEGWALAATADGYLQLWRYTGGQWTVQAAGLRQDTAWATYGAALGVGQYRLEVISGEVYALRLHSNSNSGPSYRTRGSALQALPATGLPVAVSEYVAMQAALTAGSEYRNVPRLAFWRGGWYWHDGSALRRHEDTTWRLPAQAFGATVSVAGMLLTVGEGDGNYDFGPALPAGVVAGTATSCDGVTVASDTVDLWPVAARGDGDGETWLLGLSAADLLAHRTAMIGSGGITPEPYKWDWWTVPLRLYHVGARVVGTALEELTIETSAPAHGALDVLTIEAAISSSVAETPELSAWECEASCAGLTVDEAAAVEELTIEAACLPAAALDVLTIEASVPAPQAGLEDLTIEAAISSDVAETPELSAWECEASCAGLALDETAAVELWECEASRAVVAEAEAGLSWLTIEAATALHGPEALTEGAIFPPHPDAGDGAPFTAFRLVTALPVPAVDGWRAGYRADADALDADAWDSYTPVQIGETVQLDGPARVIEIVVIGPLAVDVPAMEIQAYRAEEL